MPVAHASVAESNDLELQSMVFNDDSNENVEENSSTGITAAYSLDGHKQERQVDDFSARIEMVTPPTSEFESGIDNEQCRDDTEDFFVADDSIAGAHEREWQVDDCSTMTKETNATSVMTRDSKVASTEFVANVSKTVMSGVQPEPEEPPPKEIISVDLNVTIEMNSDNKKLGKKENATLLSRLIKCFMM